MSTKIESFSYKSYFGSAEISHEDHCLVGQVLYIDDLVMYEGETFDELEQAFQNSVDEYLEFCQQVGKSPEKTYSGSFNVRIGADLHSKAARKASAFGISLNDFVREAVRSSLEGGGANTDKSSSAVDSPFYIFETPMTESSTAQYFAEIMARGGEVQVAADEISSPARLTLVSNTAAQKVA